MVLLLFVLLINTCVLVAWGKYLNYIGAFSIDEKNEYRVFWFVTAGSILCSLLYYKVFPVWNNILGNLLSRSQMENPFVQNFLTIGPVEELLKFMVFVTLSVVFKSIKKPDDGIVQAVSVALGFALAENFNNAVTSGIDDLLYRSFFATLGHITYSGIWGFVWGSVICSRNNRIKTDNSYLIVLEIALALVIAWVFHGSYNSLLISGRYLFALLMDVSTIVLLYLVYRYVKETSSPSIYKLKKPGSVVFVVGRDLQVCNE